MPKYVRQRGTLDLYDDMALIYQHIQRTAEKIAERFNYQMITTPTFETTALYTRATGESSDIVTKEMYSFKDKGDRDISLRPEGTAGVIRAIIENKLYAINDLPLKYYYYGPFFRYERPGAGRYREFYQFGVEIVGSSSYLDDCETLLFVAMLLKELKISQYKIRINTFGDLSCRQQYRDLIKDFFRPHLDQLCPDCQNRFENNPLRMLDCKVDQAYFSTLSIPGALDSLTKTKQEEFERIKKILQENDIPFEVDSHLVRGLDYYTGLIFEIDITASDKKVYTVGGGGRYSALVKELSGPDLDCVGFALGINRLALILEDLYGKETYRPALDYYVMALDESCQNIALKVTNALREKGYRVVMENGKKSVSSMFKYAAKKHFAYAVMIGEEEKKDGTVKIKNLWTQEQQYMRLCDLLEGEKNGSVM